MSDYENAPRHTIQVNRCDIENALIAALDVEGMGNEIICDDLALFGAADQLAGAMFDYLRDPEGTRARWAIITEGTP